MHRLLAVVAGIVVTATLVVAALPAMREVLAVPWQSAAPAASRTTGPCDPCRAWARTDLRLRAAPNLEAATLTVIPAGTALGIAGTGRDGFVPVIHGDRTGWVFAAYVSPPGAVEIAGVALATATAPLNLRSGPTRGRAVIEVIPAGAVVVVTGEARDGFLPVAYDGVAGYAATAFLER